MALLHCAFVHIARDAANVVRPVEFPQLYGARGYHSLAYCTCDAARAGVLSNVPYGHIGRAVDYAVGYRHLSYETAQVRLAGCIRAFHSAPCR